VAGAARGRFASSVVGGVVGDCFFFPDSPLCTTNRSQVWVAIVGVSLMVAYLYNCTSTGVLLYRV
jgi:hypothetical protein